LRRKIITERKIDSVVQRLFKANLKSVDQGEHWSYLTEITGRTLFREMGGSSVAIGRYLQNHAEDILRHHASVNITPNHNRRAASWRRHHSPEELRTTQAENKEAVERVIRWANSFHRWLKVERNAFREGDLTGITLTQNGHRQNIDLILQCRMTGKKSIVKTHTVRRRTRAKDVAVFDDVLEISITYKKENL
jgi:hypothetical protein